MEPLACEFKWEGVTYHGFLMLIDEDLYVAARSTIGEVRLFINDQSVLVFKECPDTEALMAALDPSPIPPGAGEAP